MVLEANRLAKAGANADEVEAHVRGMMPRARIYFLVDTLEFLQRGGRIGGAQALLGSILQIKPILTFTDGRIDQFEKERTKKRALARIRELIMSEAARGADAHLTIMHTGAPDEAAALADDFPGLVRPGWNGQFPREHVNGPERQHAQACYFKSIRSIPNSIQDFINRPIAAGGHNQIERLCEWRFVGQIQQPRLYPGFWKGLQLTPQLVHHARRGVCGHYFLHMGGEQQTQGARTAAIFEHAPVRLQRHIRANARRDGAREFPPVRIVIPRGCRVVKMLHHFVPGTRDSGR